MKNLFSVIFIVAVLGTMQGCAEKPKYADPEDTKKADEHRIQAITENSNLTQAQKDWQINRIKGQMPHPGKP